MFPIFDPYLVTNRKLMNLFPKGELHPFLYKFSYLSYLVQFSRSVVSNSLWPHELQHARPPCPSPTPGVHPNSCAAGSYLSIITLNVNRLNAPTKRQRPAEWIQKQDPYICCLQDIHLKTRDTYRLKVKGWKKIFHTNGDQKKAGVAIFISDKIDFKTKAVKRDKEGYYIMIKGSIQE